MNIFPVSVPVLFVSERLRLNMRSSTAELATAAVQYEYVHSIRWPVLELTPNIYAPYTPYRTNPFLFSSPFVL